MSASGLCKRIIPCLDVADGMTVKGVNFGNLRKIGDPVELALEYQKQGADELTFLDISASHEGRETVVNLVSNVANVLSIPFTVGGGIASLEMVKRLLASGADKVSINTSAVQNPKLIEEIATHCGSQCCVVAIDARSAGAPIPGAPIPGAPISNRHQGANWQDATAWHVLIKGGRVDTGMDALKWAKECVERGAGEILLTSWDKDGTLDGFDIELTRAFSESLSVPVIASGGASGPESFIDVFERGKADAALAASIFHDGTYSVAAVKEKVHQAGVPVRIC